MANQPDHDSLFTDQAEYRFDARVIDHAIRRGSLTRQEVNTFLAELPDEAEHGVESNVKFISSFADKRSPRR
jgi:hypothetical protein